MAVQYHLLVENGGETGLALALAEGRVQRGDVESELRAMERDILDRCYMTRSYAISLRRVLGLSSDTLEKIEADHKAKMDEALKNVGHN